MHLSDLQLIDYLAGRWTPDQERSIEQHLADCDECAERSSSLYANGHFLDRMNLARLRQPAPAAPHH